MRIAVLVKQVPRFEAMELGPDGRLCRDGLALEMNPYCRRAVTQGVLLASGAGGSCTVFTLGPPAAEDVLREAVAGGADGGVLLTDPAFAGSDTLATARALAAALEALGPFDLVLLGRNSVDADTGQVGPQLAELLGLPLLAAVREIRVVGETLDALCERDDGTLRAVVRLPAVVTCAERLCDPTKRDAVARAAVPEERFTRLDAGALGPGPWGAAGSATVVGEVRVLASQRRRQVLDGDVDEQVHLAVAALEDLLLTARTGGEDAIEVPKSIRTNGTAAVAVLVEPGHDRSAQELLARAAILRGRFHGGEVVALAAGSLDPVTAHRWGADRVVAGDGCLVEEDAAHTFLPWIASRRPPIVLSPGSVWGREVASRISAALGAGITGDAVDLEVHEGRLVAWKPAFGGQLVAAITATTDVQIATVRPGVLPVMRARPMSERAEVERVEPVRRGRVDHLHQTTDDHENSLTAAHVIVGVGAGVDVGDYHRLEDLRGVLGAEMGATRKVTDRGWLPRSRQIGITGHSVSPVLYVAIGIQGKFNHTVGVRGAGFILAINPDRGAPIFDVCDIGIVADWRHAVPLLTNALQRVAVT